MSQTVDRALAILRHLGEEQHSLAEMAELLQVHKSTALRLLQSLEQGGFVRHDSSHRYRLGPELFRLSLAAIGSLDNRSIAAPHLRRLAETTQQTVHLGAFEGAEVFYIDKFEARTAVRMYSRIGASAPLHCTGVAKAILSALPHNEVRALAENTSYPRHTERTITGPEELIREIRRSAERGYAVDDREHEKYIHCIAVPLTRADGRTSHGISVSAPTIAMSWDELLGFVPLLRSTAAAISADIS